jgi:hypothetical protein
MQIARKAKINIINVLGLIFTPKLSSSKNLNSPALVAGAGAVLCLRLSLLLLKIAAPNYRKIF